MPSTTATCVYRANAFGLLDTDLAALIDAAAVPVEPAMLEVTGCTVASDNTVPAGGVATRTIVLNLTPQFKSEFPDGTDQTAPFWAFMLGLLENSANSPIIAAAPVIA